MIDVSKYNYRLMPCPFCGESATVDVDTLDSASGDASEFITIGCDTHGCRGSIGMQQTGHPFQCINREIDRWNRRPVDFAAHCEKAAAIVATWPAWKRGILGYSSQPTRKEPRQPVDNSRESGEKIVKQKPTETLPSPLASEIRKQLLSPEFIAAFANAFVGEFGNAPLSSLHRTLPQEG